MAKKSRKTNTAQVVIPTGHPNPPEQHEVEVAWILARHFGAKIEFLLPVDDYMRKTQDIILNGIEWE
jgi:hypothetical protein